MLIVKSHNKCSVNDEDWKDNDKEVDDLSPHSSSPQLYAHVNWLRSGKSLETCIVGLK